MNERIQALAKGAKHAVEQEGIILELALEKFAELIVEECLDLVDRGGEFVSRPKLVERIKEHFGVEE